MISRTVQRAKVDIRFVEGWNVSASIGHGEEEANNQTIAR